MDFSDMVRRFGPTSVGGSLVNAVASVMIAIYSTLVAPPFAVVCVPIAVAFVGIYVHMRRRHRRGQAEHRPE